MKIIRIVLFLGLLCHAPLAFADALPLNLNIPEVRVNALQGNGIVALKVEDARKDTSIGRDSDGDDLVVGRDVASSLMDSYSTPMRIAGFSLTPYRADAPLIMLVRVEAIAWTSSNDFLSSKVHLSARFAVRVIRHGKVTAERTIRVNDDYTVVWHPYKSRIEELVSETLGDGVRAVLQDHVVTAALQSNPVPQSL